MNHVLQNHCYAAFEHPNTGGYYFNCRRWTEDPEISGTNNAVSTELISCCTKDFNEIRKNADTKKVDVQNLKLEDEKTEIVVGYYIEIDPLRNNSESTKSTKAIATDTHNNYDGSNRITPAAKDIEALNDFSNSRDMLFEWGQYCFVTINFGHYEVGFQKMIISKFLEIMAFLEEAYPIRWFSTHVGLYDTVLLAIAMQLNASCNCYILISFIFDNL